MGEAFERLPDGELKDAILFIAPVLRSMQEKFLGKPYSTDDALEYLATQTEWHANLVKNYKHYKELKTAPEKKAVRPKSEPIYGRTEHTSDSLLYELETWWKKMEARADGRKDPRDKRYT